MIRHNILMHPNCACPVCKTVNRSFFSGDIEGNEWSTYCRHCGGYIKLDRIGQSKLFVITVQVHSFDPDKSRYLTAPQMVEVAGL